MEVDKLKKQMKDKYKKVIIDMLDKVDNLNYLIKIYNFIRALID